MCGRTDGGNRRGMTPAEVDKTPVWQIAAFIGSDIDRVAEAKAREEDPDGLLSPSDDLIERRMRHARGEGPAPDAAPTPTSVVAALAPGLIGGADPRG